MLDEVEADMRSVGEGPEAVSTSTRWSRPPVPSFDAVTNALIYQQFDVDFHTGIVTRFSAHFGYHIEKLFELHLCTCVYMSVNLTN